MAYTAIEYIQSTGTQYIDTGYYASDKTKVEISFENNTTSPKYMFGSRTSWKTNDYSITYDGQYLFYYHNNEIYHTESYDGIKIAVSEIPSLTINGVTLSASEPGEYECAYPLFIFAINNHGEVYKQALMKLYYMKIWDDGTLIFDLIPVLDENNVACLYNKVTGTYLYNAGTGDFVAGNPIVLPTITIGTPSRTKISSITGYDQATVTFQSDIALQSWEARATTEGQTIGHGSGLLVESGGSLEANTDATVYVDDEELTSGDLEYTISIFGQSIDGRWSDG